MNKSESKYFNTAVKMDEAFLTLLHKKEFEFITVKEICALAKVNRSTFYLHYETINDLLLETVEYINGKFSSYFNDLEMIDITKIQSLPEEELHLVQSKYLTPWLNFIFENRKLFMTCLKKYSVLQMNKNYEYIYDYVVTPVFERHKIAKENREYIFRFYIEGIMAIIKQWIINGCSRSIEDISNLIVSCVYAK